MECMGFQKASPKTLDAEAEKLLKSLNEIADENDTEEGKFVHSIIFSWDEAFMVEKKLVEFTGGSTPKYKSYANTDLPYPRNDLESFGEYRGIRLYVKKPVDHVAAVREGPSVE